MNILTRILKSLQDGSFAIKALNRISSTKYVPSKESLLDKFLPEQYPETNWKRLSSGAKQTWIDLSPVFAKIQIQNIAYVGAHDGEVALAIDEAFPMRHFYLIEAVPATFQKLVGNVSTRPNMKCFNAAAGAKEEQLDMFVDSFSPASSLLPYEKSAIQEFPFLGHVQTLKVKVKPLDHILQECNAGKIDMLVVDVQGYEDEVLQGAAETLKSCKVIMSELSLEALYKGSSTFDTVYHALLKEGFYLQHLLNPIRGANRRILQIDGIFVRI